MKPLDQSNAVIAQVDVTTQAVQAAQQEAEIKNAAIRQAERQAKFDAWKDPEAMIYRRALNDKIAMESLWELRASGNAVTQTPLPPESELPKEMRGQSPSTIRAMLRGNKEWEKKVKAHQEIEAERGGFRRKHPELFGLDDSKSRELYKTRVNPARNMDGSTKTFSVKEQPIVPYANPSLIWDEPEKPKTWWDRVAARWFK